MKNKVIKNLLLALSLFSGSLLHAKYDQSSFDNNAEQFGNKTANLVELQNIADELNKKQANRFKVPSFFGVSHDVVKKYLGSISYQDSTVANYIQQQWKAFVNTQKNNRISLLPESKKILLDIRVSVKRAFADQTKVNFFLQQTFNNKSVENFLNDAKNKKLLLMVRSTGREDSKELSNAGGNESISSVEPNMVAVAQAMGEVITSYFSEKSIEQRILAKDKGLFANPFMPVLLQVMIGEPIGGAKEIKNIPVSGVMFSQEARGRTPGVAQIEATFGHNEGVVNGLVAVDAYYVGSTKIIHPLVRVKRERLVTIKPSELGPIKNPEEIQEKPCLNKQAVLDLKTCAVETQQYYNYPHDIEFVLQNEVIYLVQARPIEKQIIDPSFLKTSFVDQLDAQNKLGVVAIGSGDAAVKKIDNAQQIIVAQNIRVALKVFQDAGQERDAIKAIIIAESAPAMSHEATIFRGAQKPVLYTQNSAAIKKWLDGKVPILVDPQRGLIATTKKFKQGDIQKGWFAHPIPKKTSFFKEFYVALSDEENKKIKPILRQAHDERMAKEDERNSDKKIEELVQLIKESGDKEEVINAIRSLRARIESMLLSALIRAKLIQKAPLLPKQIMQLLEFTPLFCSEVMRAFDIWGISKKTEEDRLSRLYPMVFLQALIEQKPQPQEYVNNNSLDVLVAREEERERAAKELELKSLDPMQRAFFVRYAKVADQAFAKETTQDWKQFLLNLAKIKDKQIQNDFAQMMVSLADMNMFNLWLNVSFPAVQKKDAQSTTQALIDEYKKSETLLEVLQKIKERMLTFSLVNWENPDLFEKTLESFKKDIVDHFMSSEFLNSFKTAGSIGKLALLNIMQEFAKQFDESIKTLKGSVGKYSDKQQLVKRFRQMIGLYFDVFKIWATKIPSLSDQLANQTPRKEWGSAVLMTMKGYFYAIATIFNKTGLSINELEPASDFNVGAAVFGSRALWERSVGQQPRLENIFSLIHQNLLFAIATLAKDFGVANIKVPESVAKLKKSIKDKLPGLLNKLANQDYVPSPLNMFFLGVELEDKKITYLYNIPLRNHSMTFQIVFDKKNNQILISVQFYGDNNLRRWNKVAKLAWFSLKFSHLSFEKEPEATKTGYSNTWLVLADKEAIFEDIPFYIVAMISVSIDRPDGSYKQLLQIPNFANRVLEMELPNPKDKYLVPYLLFYSVLIENDSTPPAQIKKLVKKITPLINKLIDLRKISDEFFILLSTLVKKNEGLEAAIRVAQIMVALKGQYRIDPYKRNFLVNLVDKEKGINEAFEIIKYMINTKMNWYFISPLLIKLIEKKKIIDDLIAIVKNAANSQNNFIRSNGLRLFIVLVKNGIGFNQAKQAVENNINSKDDKVRVSAQELKKIL